MKLYVSPNFHESPDLKGTAIVAIVGIVVIVILSSIFIYIGLPAAETTENSVVTAPPETASLAYVTTFAYGANPILAGQNQTITIEITQGSYQIADVSGGLFVTFPNGSYYQTFGYTTDSNGEASFNFFIAPNTTPGTFNVFATIVSLGELIQNTSSSFEVVTPT